MDWLKTQLERVQRQLAGLSATQKMLTASLVAIMVITVLWWGRYAGEAEMVPLLNQSFSTPDIGRIDSHLQAKQYRYTVSGDRILVPADKRLEILSDLTYARLMPQNTSAGFDEIMKQMSPFDSSTKEGMIWNQGKQLMLGQIIGGFPNVAKADVLIDPNARQRLEGGQEKSATVNIATIDGKVTQALVDAAAGAVVGAEAGLLPDHVKVVVDGYAQRVHGDGNPMANATDQLQAIQQSAAYKESQVRAIFHNIPQLQVSVTMILNTTTTSTEQQTYDGKNAIQKEQKSMTDKEETTLPAQSGGEAGAQPNTGANVQPAQGGGAGGTQSRTKEETTYVNLVPTTRTTSQTPAGNATPVSAAVQVPLSYFVSAYKAMEQSDKEPTYKQLQPFIKGQIEEMKETVVKCVGLKSANDVSMNTFVEPAPALAAGMAVAGPSVGSVSFLFGGHAKEIALGALAVMSLFMASMMVRKGAPVAVPLANTAADAAGPTTILEGGEPLAGEASAGNPLLDGMELNEDAVRAQQMVDQVSTMVKENPEAAANLVKRWMSRT